MEDKRETATADERETRAGAPPKLGGNRRDRRALRSIGRQLENVDRQIAEAEAREAKGGDDAGK